MELDPKRLLILRRIADAGSVAGASRALGHTPSAVSQQLGRLEREVGVPLVDRTGGRAELTAAGRLLAGHGDRIGQALQDAARDLRALGGAAAGPVAIGVPPPAITFFATTAVHVLARTHPDLAPRLVESDRQDGLRALRLGELDLLVIEDDQQEPTPLPNGVEASVMVEDAYRLVVPHDWPAPTDAAHLSARPWIGAPAGSPRQLAFQRLAAQHGIAPSVEHTARYRFAVYSMLAARLGAAILPAHAAALIGPGAGTVTTLPVPGTYLVRLLRRTGPWGAPPAVLAAAEALQSALLMASERLAAQGLTEGEPRVNGHLVDPSEQAAPDGQGPPTVTP
ncbi:DNA-binding transcriptional LysR family regulator [Kitasatospora sp. MAA19]|uniref:LysR family transcriptional regulator n=1 Tax=unclassified Kitasatospora TaxID=2633591 RepID=UPI002472F380|nr:LysR family transcriptional regulator [Kitasatospora sp. MAA19]MDH6707550.1 DNA-binding transcriptional LysR family regulator [Kitasatospora sp. MAA19]